MVARVSTFEGSPERLEEGVRLFRETVLPWMRDATGFRGAMMLIDRANDRLLAVTFWASEEIARDPERSGGVLRDEIAEGVGTPMRDVSLYEVELLEGLSRAEGS